MEDIIFSEYTSYGRQWARNDLTLKRKLNAKNSWTTFKTIMDIKMEDNYFIFKNGGFDSGYTFIIMEEMIRENPEFYAMYALKK